MYASRHGTRGLHEAIERLPGLYLNNHKSEILIVHTQPASGIFATLRDLNVNFADRLDPINVDMLALLSENKHHNIDLPHSTRYFRI